MEIKDITLTRLQYRYLEACDCRASYLLSVKELKILDSK